MISHFLCPSYNLLNISNHPTDIRFHLRISVVTATDVPQKVNKAKTSNLSIGGKTIYIFVIIAYFFDVRVDVMTYFQILLKGNDILQKLFQATHLYTQYSGNNSCYKCFTGVIH